MTTDIFTHARCDDIERALVGACLMFSEALDEAAVKLRPHFLLRQDCRIIFETMIAMKEAKAGVDLKTVCCALRDADLLEKAGGAANISSMVDGIPMDCRISDYLAIVREKAMLRATMKGANAIMTRASQGIDSASSILLDGLGFFSTLAGEVAEEDSRPLTYRQAGTKLLGRLDAGTNAKVFTGIEALDSKVGGFLPGELVVITAETGVGKTGLASQIRRTACRKGLHGVYASGEMSGMQLAARELAGYSGVPIRKFRQSHAITEGERQAVLASMGKLCNTCRVLDGHLTMERIRLATLEMSRTEKVEFLIVDYDELVEVKGDTENEQQINLYRQSRQLATEVDCPLIMVSQLRKPLTGEDRKKPTLARVYGSGVKVKDASVVIYADRQFVRELNGDETQAIVSVLKNRDGRVGAVECVFDVRKLEFHSVEESNEIRIP